MFFLSSDKYYSSFLLLNYLFFIFISVLFATPLSKYHHDNISPLFNDTTDIATGVPTSTSTKRWFHFLPFNHIKKCSVEDEIEFIVQMFKYPSLVISKGSDWAIYKWTRPSDNMLMLVKGVNKHHKDLQKALNREMRLLSRLHGEGITADIDCIFEDFLNYQYYMKPLLEGTSVTADNVFNPASSNINLKWAQICLQMAKVVNQIHRKGVVLLDLRLPNWILSPEGKLYINDFSGARNAGFFHVLRQSLSLEAKQTPGCSSIVNDTWMLGKAFAHLYKDMTLNLSKYRGFTESNRNDTLLAVQEVIDTSWIEAIIEGMMNKDPTMRYSIKESIVMLTNLEKKWEKAVAKKLDPVVFD